MYPPLGLYLVAVLSAEGLEWFRILPAVFAVATLPASVAAGPLAGREPSGGAARPSPTALPSVAYVGLTAGGGVARAPGVAFALLTLWAAG